MPFQDAGHSSCAQVVMDEGNGHVMGLLRLVICPPGASAGCLPDPERLSEVFRKGGEIS